MPETAPPPESPFVMWATRPPTDGPQQDLAEVRRALTLLTDPAKGVQLQADPGWGDNRLTARGADFDALCAWVAERRSAIGIYYALNPVSPTLDRALKNGDPLCRRWLLIDVDRNKTIEKKLSSTHAEKEAAREVAATVVDFLAAEGWPSPLLVDSGNGFHLLYRVDLPNDNFAKAIIASFLKGLSRKFDSDSGKIGKECHDARRVAKLPGTWARRGQETADRPHRLSRILRVPPGLLPVPAKLIQDTTERIGERPRREEPPPAADEPFVLRVNAGNDQAYARAAFERECTRMALAKPGELNDQLFRSGAACGNFVPHLLSEGEVFEALLSAARSAGADNPSKDADTLRRAIALGKSKPRHAPDRNGAAAHHEPAGTLIIYRASEVTPKKVEWLWQDRIPLGKLTTFAGVGGLGKTFVLCDVTARVSRSMDWPDSAGECCKGGQVLFVSGEDDADDTLVPRLIELGADLDKVAFLKTEVQDRFTLADLKTLDKALEQMGAGVRFVAIDPPTAYLGNVDDHKNAELRGLLSPLKSWAARHRVAVVFNTHVNKGGGQKVEAMARVMGSVAWVNAVRAAHMFAADPDDSERCLFIPMKMNLAKKRKGLAYQIEVTESLARLKWLGDVDTTADDAMNRQARQSRAVQATDFLRQLFTNRKEIPSEEIWASGRAAGLSVNAIKEAKAKMRIRAVRRPLPGDHQLWFWIWPDEATVPEAVMDGSDEVEI